MAMTGARLIGAVVVGMTLIGAAGIALRSGPAWAASQPRWEDRAPGERAPANLVARRRWALAQMDEMARERLRCRERFKAPRQVEECESHYARRFRMYNDLYLEAARD